MYAFFITTEADAQISNHLTSAAFFATLAVTVWTTALIAYRIYSTSNLALNRKKLRFYNILEMIVQTSFAYSLALAPCALLGVIPETQSNIFTMVTASYYADVILSATTVR